MTLASFDYIGFHGPYGKLVQKGTARLEFIDYLADQSNEKYANVPAEYASMPRSKSLLNKDCEKAFIALSAQTYKNAVWPSTQCMRRLGNMYTASVYGGLASIVDSVQPSDLQGKTIALFSFGSGLAASFFTITVRGDTTKIRDTLNLKERLATMTSVTPCQDFVDALKASSLSSCVSSQSDCLYHPQLREDKHNIKNYTPTATPDLLKKGTYYLEKVDDLARRFYAIKA